MNVVAVGDPNHLLEGCQRKSLVPVWQERRAVYVLIRRGHARFLIGCVADSERQVV